MNKSNGKLSEKLKQSKILNKVKNIKHFELIAIIIFVSVLLLFYFNDSNSGTYETTYQTFTSYESYTKDLESRLSSILSKIKGAGKVNTMITLEGTPELVIAYNVQQTSDYLGTKDGVTIKKEPIIITKNGTSSPLVLSESLPQIKGIVIVAQGANDVTVKLNLISATTKLLNISSSAIEIFAGN